MPGPSLQLFTVLTLSILSCILANLSFRPRLGQGLYILIIMILSDAGRCLALLVGKQEPITENSHNGSHAAYPAPPSGVDSITDKFVVGLSTILSSEAPDSIEPQLGANGRSSRRYS